MKEPAPTGLGPSNMVDQSQRDTEQKTVNSLNQAGHNVKIEDISAETRFPTDFVEGMGGEVVDKVRDTAEYLKAAAEGSTHVRTTDSKRPISIASVRERLRGLIRKRAA